MKDFIVSFSSFCCPWWWCCLSFPSFPSCCPFCPPQARSSYFYSASEGKSPGWWGRIRNHHSPWKIPARTITIQWISLKTKKSVSGNIESTVSSMNEHYFFLTGWRIRIYNFLPAVSTVCIGSGRNVNQYRTYSKIDLNRSSSLLYLLRLNPDPILSNNDITFSYYLRMFLCISINPPHPPPPWGPNHENIILVPNEHMRAKFITQTDSLLFSLHFRFFLSFPSSSQDISGLHNIYPWIYPHGHGEVIIE